MRRRGESDSSTRLISWTIHLMLEPLIVPVVRVVGRDRGSDDGGDVFLFLFLLKHFKRCIPSIVIGNLSAITRDPGDRSFVACVFCPLGREKAVMSDSVPWPPSRDGLRHRKS